MSIVSRQREFNRRYRGGFPTWAAFRASQLVKLPLYTDTPAALARRAKVEEMLAQGLVADKAGSDTFVEGEPMPDAPFDVEVDARDRLMLDNVPQPA